MTFCVENQILSCNKWSSFQNPVLKLDLTIYFCSCTKPLKLWPKGIGPNVFKCQIGQECDPELLKDFNNLEKHVHHQHGGATEAKLIDNLNTGSSRYSCYEDGFDVCNRCADEVSIFSKN